MTFLYDGDLYELPNDLSGITLAKLQEWSATYGHALSLEGIEARAIADEENRRLRLTILFYDEITAALATFASPTIPLETIRANIELGQIASLLADSSIVLAIQGPQLFIPEQILTPPASVLIDDISYDVLSPTAGLVLESLSHEEFVCSLQMARYLLELAEGDWSHFHLLCAGYLRLPGEVISLSIIDPAGARATIMHDGLTAFDAAPLAQYFTNHTAEIISILDAYTNAQFGAP